MPFGVGYYTTVIYNDTGKVSRRKLKKIRNAALSVSLRSKLHHAGGGTAINGRGGVFYHGGVFAGQGGQDRQGQVLFTIFLRKHFRFWQEKGIFSEKLQKNHKKIAIFAVSGIDFAITIEYNTLGILC